MADVFLSYRNLPDRRALVTRLATILRAHGIEVWWDYGLEAGESYRGQITRELGEATIVLVLWDEESIASKWVIMEAELGKDKLLPVKLQDIAPPDAFESVQAHDLTGWDGSVLAPRAVDLVNRICDRLGKPRDIPVDLREELSGLKRLKPLPRPKPVNRTGSGETPRAGRGLGLIASLALAAAALSGGTYWASGQSWWPLAGDRTESPTTSHPDAGGDLVATDPETTAPEASPLSADDTWTARWAEVDQNDPHAIRAFLDREPTGPAAAEAQQSWLGWASADWGQTLSAGTVEAYQSHAELYVGLPSAAAASAGLAGHAETIEDLQDALKKKAFYTGASDGLVGLGTRQAVAVAASALNQTAPDLSAIDISPVDAFTNAIERWERPASAARPGLRWDDRTKPNRAPGSSFRDSLSSGGSGPEMVVVPSGSFRMGSPSSETGRDDEGPQRDVRIGYEFAVGKYEVTWAEWEVCVADGGCSNSGPASKGGDEGWGKGNRPVINVDWNDAKAYVRWLSGKTGAEYRLLSEAEWEYVARAGTTSAYAFGNTITTSQANFRGDNYLAQTVPVGSYPPNRFGLYDMHGNVSEWTEDCWNDSYGGAPSDGRSWVSGDCSRRVVRGGSWFIYPSRLRSAYRGWGNPSSRYETLGFRVARTLEE